MYKYYKDRNILPTYSGFTDKSQLLRYQESRKDLFVNKIKLPIQLFNGTNLIEFGPDTGENALVFANWGAKVTLVEPNQNAIPYIKDYFNKFDLANSLLSIENTDLNKYRSKETFDFVIAEGFIHSVKPTEDWIIKFNKLLKQDGFFIITYLEKSGAFIELFHKLIFHFLINDSDKDPEKIAWKLFKNKWNSIPHTRPFNSWFRDVLENPYVRLKYFNNADDLIKKVCNYGFSLYSSWPNYDDCLDIYWHKKAMEKNQIINKKSNFIKRSRLSFVFGQKSFYTGDYSSVTEIDSYIKDLINIVDNLIDSFNTESIEACIRNLEKIESVISSDCFSENKDKKGVTELLSCIKKLFFIMKENNISYLVDFCNNNKCFIENWGMPNHFCVFQKIDK